MSESFSGFQNPKMGAQQSLSDAHEMREMIRTGVAARPGRKLLDVLEAIGREVSMPTGRVKGFYYGKIECVRLNEYRVVRNWYGREIKRQERVASHQAEIFRRLQQKFEETRCY